MADTNPIPMQSDPIQPDLHDGNEPNVAELPGGNELDVVQQQSQDKPGFPQFPKLPLEIQIQIFTEAIGKPNIQLLTNPKQQYVSNGTFTVSFRPDRKCQGISGYRRLVTLSLVNRTAYAAVRLATAKNTVRLPFKQLNNRIDGSLDLVFINLPAFPTPDKNCFHRDYRRPYSRWFNEERQADSFRGIQKVAFNYDNKAMILWSGHRIYCSVQSFFGCPDAGFLHYQHLSWKFCPDEFAAFLDCFPDLHEVYIVLDMPRRRSDDRIRLNTYITNYYTLPSASTLRRNLSVFHSSTISYIEFSPALAYRFPKARRGEHVTLESFEVGLVDQVGGMLKYLRTRCLLKDAAPNMPPREREARAAEYRMSRAQREGLVFKILLPVPDDRKVGWQGEEADKFLAALKKVGGQ